MGGSKQKAWGILFIVTLLMVTMPQFTSGSHRAEAKNSTAKKQKTLKPKKQQKQRVKKPKQQKQKPARKKSAVASAPNTSSTTTIVTVPPNDPVFNVDTTVDDVALSGCNDATANDCSLRGAIAAANTLPSTTIVSINLPSGTYKLITANGELLITHDLTLTGAGATTTIIDGDKTNGGSIRVLEIASSKAVTIDGVTIQGGNAGSTASGGGIFNKGALTLSNSTVTGNSSGGNGGGILNLGGTLTLTNNTVSNNTAQGDGGGVNNNTNATLTLTNSTVTGNSSGGNGGGILNLGDMLTLTNSTVSNNTAQGDGGGVNNNTNATLTLTNSTVTGNSSSSFGGGIENLGSNTLTLTNSTVSNNTAQRNGGGIRNSAATLTLRNTIVANNSLSSGASRDCSQGGTGTITSQGHNLDSDGSCNLTDTTDLPKRDPLLGQLGNHGGPTFTQPLLFGSPAIDAGDPTGCTDARGNPLLNDQRGVIRPLDGNRDGRAFCDIGAYEVSLTPLDVDRTDDEATATACTAAPNDCSLRGAITAANALPLTSTAFITLPPSTYNLSAGELFITHDLTLDGGGAATTSIDSGGASRVVKIASSDSAVAIDGITIQGGNAVNDFGGGINNFGTLALSNSTVSNSTANFGGGINNFGTLALSNSTVSNNSSTINGGGIATSGIVTLANSTVHDNSSTSDGGGISNFGTLTLTNSTIHRNSSKAKGGGVFNGSGDSSGDIILVNSTISNNTAQTSGGGFFNDSTFTLKNTLVANNTGNGGGGNCGGNSSVTSQGHNLDSDGSCLLNGPGDQSGTVATILDPLLGPLQDNRGSTLTQALLVGSPAVDAGDNTGCPATDQRGVARPLDGDGNGSAVCDIGAYEVDAANEADLVLALAEAPTLAGGNLSYTLMVTNRGPAATTASTVTFRLPPGVTLVSAAPSQGVCSQNGDLVTCDLGALALGASGTIALVVTPAGTGLLTLTASVAATQVDPDRRSNSVSVNELFVDRTDDDASDAAKACTAAANDCSLRGAIAAANLLSGTVLINVPAGTYLLNATNGELFLSRNVTLAGAGSASTIIDGGGNDRVIQTGSLITIGISEVTIQGGNAGSNEGGGLYNSAILTLTNSTIRGNLSSTGGGLYNNAGELTLINSTVSNNSSTNDGGGISSGSTLTIINTTIRDNSSGGLGGGIHNFSGLTLTNSTIRNNTSTGAGGGLSNNETLTLTNSTVSNNTSLGDGGGVRINGGTVTLTNATVSNNTGTNGGGLSNNGALSLLNSTVNNNTGTNGGGLNNSDSLTLKNTLVANNTLTNGTLQNCVGTVTSQGHNLDSDNTCQLTEPTDLLNRDPLLGPLQDNGGPTFTQAVRVGSPALDAGDNAGCPATDQRGVARPLDSDGNGSAECDIGAVEFQRVDVQVSKTVAPLCPAGQDVVYQLQVTNVGANATTGPLVLTDPLPTELNFVAGSGTGWSCAVDGATGVVTCTLAGPLAAGATSDLTLTLHLQAGFTGSLTNTATVATAGDTDPNNDTMTVSCVQPVIDLLLTKSHTDMFQAGGQGRYTLRVTNQGTISTTGLISITDTLPAGLQFVSGSTAEGWSCVGGPPVTCTRTAALDANQSTTVTLTVALDPTTAASITNTATVTTPEDNNPDNNTASDPTTVTPQPRTLLWGETPPIAGTATRFDTAHAVTVDTLGNVIAAGIVANTGTGDDFTVVKSNGVDGSVSWKPTLNGTANSSDAAFAVTVDPSTNAVIAVGYTTNNDTGRDLTVVKYAVDGAAAWPPRKISGAFPNGQDEGFAVALSGSDVIVAGMMQSRANSWDFIVLKLSGDTGDELWRYTLPGGKPTQANAAYAVAVDSAGNVFAAGHAGNEDKGLDFTIVKLAKDTGTTLWGPQTLHGTTVGGGNEAFALAIEPTTGDVVVAGVLENEGTGSDFTVIRFANSDGAQLWRGDINIPESTVGGYDAALSVTIDPSGDVIVGGMTENNVTGIDFTVVKLSGNDGKQKWLQSISGDVTKGFDEALAVAVDVQGNALAAGVTKNINTGLDFTIVELDREDGAEHWRDTKDGTAHGRDAALAIAVDPLRAKVAAAGWLRESTDHASFTVRLYQGSLP